MKLLKFICLFIVLSVFSWGCASDPASEIAVETISPVEIQLPPMDETGDLPRAALLPIIDGTHQKLADDLTRRLRRSLRVGNAFKLVCTPKVGTLVTGVDVNKLFGMTPEDFTAIAEKLEVTYLLSGRLELKRELTPQGWKQAMDVKMDLFSGETGERLTAWEIMTEYIPIEQRWSRRDMVDSAAERICDEIMKKNY